LNTLQVRTLFTDQNQTQHNSWRSVELLNGQNSSAEQRGLAHKWSTYKLSVSFSFLNYMLFVSCHRAQQKRPGRF
jgi:hypothetical protein